MRMNMQTQLLSNVNPIVVVHKKTATRIHRLPFFWRCHPDSDRGMKVLQTFALPLGYGTKEMER